MISKNKSLLSKNLGKTRRSLRGSRGRRETNHHFLGISLKDNRVLELRKAEVGGKMPRQPPMECWGCKGNHRYMDCPHKSDKVRFVHHVRQEEIVEDMGRSVPKIYVALDNKQA